MQQQELAEDISTTGFAKKTLDLIVYVFGDDSIPKQLDLPNQVTRYGNGLAALNLSPSNELGALKSRYIIAQSAIACKY